LDRLDKSDRLDRLAKLDRSAILEKKRKRIEQKRIEQIDR
jgi:hypothetical protein